MVIFKKNWMLSRSVQTLIIIILFFCMIGRCEAIQEKLDLLAVEQTLKAWFTNNPFVKMYGINQDSETSATAHFVINRKGKERDARANMLYFIDKGWFIIRIESGWGSGRNWWSGVYEKVERKAQ